MLGAYASVALVCAGSLLVGHAILALCGHPKWTWLSGPVGFAAILVVSGVAIKLGGHGASVEVIFGLLVLASAVVVAPRWRIPDTRSVPVLLTAALALLVASIPFIANQRVGILGVGLVNDDMANHLLIADWLRTHVGDMPVLIHQGYPVGPHALVAGLSKGLGTGLVEAFAGLTLAIPVLTAAVAFEALRDLRPAARVVAAVLVAMPYLAAAYLAQEAFKEPIEALFLLSFALLLPAATSPRRAVPLAVIAAGATYVYSFPGLFWLAAAAAIYLGIVAIAQKPDPRAGEVEVSESPPAREVTSGQRTGVLISVAVGVGVLAVLTAPEWTRMIDFGGFRAFSTSSLSGGLGNLRHQLSPLEAFGIWPTSEFRLAASDSSHPAAFYAGGVIAAVALVVGLPRWFRRYGPALPAALAAAVLGYVGARLFGTVYTSAKSLAIAAPLIALVSFGGLLADEPPRRREWATAGLAAILAAGMALSSFLVLRQTPVAPTDHANQLGELRPMVQGQKVLFLGRDNFIAYELRGSRPFTAVRNYYDPHYVKPDLRLKDVFRKFDFDSVHPKTLDRFPYVITTSAAYASGPPPNFEPVRETADFVLWKRTGPVGPRRTLGEGDEPGVRLACPSHDETKLLRNGRVTVFAKPPVVGGRWSPGSTVEGGVITQSLQLPAGRWEISLQYDATQPLRVSAPGFDATVPANLDYRGSVPYYHVGALTVKQHGPVRFSVQEESPPFLGRVLGTKAQAHLGAIAVSPAGPGGPIPGEAEDVVSPRDACGRYVDSYSPAGSR